MIKSVIFDLDGVISDSADIHAEAWKQVFDETLAGLSAKAEYNTREFEKSEDYRRYVDGKSREEGIRSFLQSRGISLEVGPRDSTSVLQLNGIANKKNQVFRQILARIGPRAYYDAENAIERALRSFGTIAVASSSTNCEWILDQLGLTRFFTVIVSGNTAIELKIPSKPQPDIFLEAASQLKIDIRSCMVVEDSPSGVVAALKAHAGRIVGIDRGHNTSIADLGAHEIVTSLDQIVF